MEKIKKLIKRKIVLVDTNNGYYLKPDKLKDINLKFSLTNNIKELGLYNYHIEAIPSHISFFIVDKNTEDAIEGAKIKIINTITNYEFEGLSNEMGFFEFILTQPQNIGDYEWSVSKENYTTKNSTEVLEIDKGDNELIYVELEEILPEIT